jgi:hypothetical protein
MDSPGKKTFEKLVDVLHAAGTGTDSTSAAPTFRPLPVQYSSGGAYSTAGPDSAAHEQYQHRSASEPSIGPTRSRARQAVLEHGSCGTRSDWAPPTPFAKAQEPCEEQKPFKIEDTTSEEISRKASLCGTIDRGTRCRDRGLIGRGRQ